MEALQNYYGDSDLSISDEEISKPDSKEYDSSVIEPYEHDQKNSYLSETTNKCDFFHLQQSDSDHESEPEIKMRKTENIKLTSSNGDMVTIPSGDFWRPLTQELQKSQNQDSPIKISDNKRLDFESTGRYGAPKTDFSLKKMSKKFSSNKFIKKPSKDSYKEIKSVSNNEQLTSQHQNKSQSTVSTKIFNEDTVSDKILSSCKSDTTKKPLLVIHGKLNPWLQRKHDHITNKLPRKCSKNWKAHGGSVSTLKWNVSKFSHLLLTVSMDTTIKVWNVWSQSDACVREVQVHSKGIQTGDWSNTGTHILTCSYDKKAVVTDVETGQPVTTCSHKSYVTCGKWHPVNDYVFLTGSQDEIAAWDTRQSDEPIHIYSYKDKIGQIQDLVFSRDGREFFSTGDLISRDSADRNIMAWDFNNAVVKSNQIYQERFSCTCLKLHPTESNFLAQSHGNYIALFSAVKPYKMCRSLRYEGHKLAGYKIGFDISPDGQYIVSGDATGNIYSYDYKHGRLLQTIPTNLDVNLDVAFHPVLPSTLACCGWNGFIELWN